MQPRARRSAIDLTTHYLGLTLAHPLMLGASPLVDDLDAVRRAEDFVASAERAEHETPATHGESFGEALYYKPHRGELPLDPHRYLEQIRRIKDAVAIPVIASLNGTTNGGWLV
jgi:dihydroorotate dehydrogenase (fumarate)